MTNRENFDRFLPGGFLAAAGVLISLLFAFTPVSRAASVTYVGANATTFSGGGGGWTSDQDYDGLCVLGITCPQMSGSVKTTGGTGGNGDGYLRTTAGPTSVASLLSLSTQFWNSPSFTYKGVSGKNPAALTFSLQKRNGFGALLALGADARYTVIAVNQSGGADRTLLSTRSVGGSENWQAVAKQPLLGDSLKVGNNYSIQIRTQVGGLAAVLPGGHVDYDNVALVASDGTGTGGPGGNGGNGNNGNNGNNGSNGSNGSNGNAGPKRFRPRIRKATKHTVRLKKRARGVRAAKVTCRSHAPCRIRRVQVRYIIHGKVYHRGKARFPHSRFGANRSKFVRVTMPKRIFRKTPRGRKVGFVKVRVVATSRNGARSTRNVAIGIGKK